MDSGESRSDDVAISYAIALIRAGTQSTRWRSWVIMLLFSGRSLVVKSQPSKLATWVRFPSPAPTFHRRTTAAQGTTDWPTCAGRNPCGACSATGSSPAGSGNPVATTHRRSQFRVQTRALSRQRRTFCLAVPRLDRERMAEVPLYLPALAPVVGSDERYRLSGPPHATGAPHAVGKQLL